jgi:hypothetical protein
VTGAEKRGYTEAQASTAVRAIIDDFCPQWKVLLRQQGYPAPRLAGTPPCLRVHDFNECANRGLERGHRRLVGRHR